MGTHKLETAEGGTHQNMKKTKQVTGTHKLETTEGGTHQNMPLNIERNQASDRHSQTGDHRGRDLSGQR